MSSNLHNWLNIVAKNDLYLDISVIVDDKVKLRSCKLYVFCKYPYLVDCLEAADLLIIDETFSVTVSASI